VFKEFVDYIINWLYQNATDLPVILMGHSMVNRYYNNNIFKNDLYNF